MNKSFLPLFILVAFAFLSQAAAAETRKGLNDQGPGEHMLIQAAGGEKEWYSALELEQVARAYATQQKLNFQFEGTEMNIWVLTGGGKVLADVSWSRGFGKPVLRISIARNGKAISHHIGTAVEGHHHQALPQASPLLQK